MDIYLASSSLRRSELLNQIIGNNFTVVSSSFEEDNSQDISPFELATSHAIGKASCTSLKSGLVIGADTFVYFNNRVLGKPLSEDDAVSMLMEISGQNVEVYSGICVFDVSLNEKLFDCVVTKVKMASFTEEEAQSYVDTGEPLDKAGSFAIQGKGAILVEKIDGCYFNVMGLPLFSLSKLLKNMGVDVLKEFY